VTQRVRGSVEIAVPVADAFGYVGDPERSVELLPDVVDVSDFESLPNGGHRARFKALGQGGGGCNWVSETLERVPDRRVFVRATIERLSTVGTRGFTESRNGTRVDVTVEYDVEMPCSRPRSSR
jgi:Polyketide cyclase / dehydrase and lipid transport